jgi:hypothetical protein
MSSANFYWMDSRAKDENMGGNSFERVWKWRTVRCIPHFVEDLCQKKETEQDLLTNVGINLMQSEGCRQQIEFSNTLLVSEGGSLNYKEIIKS